MPRRRRRIHRSTSMAGDPLDLFQHAMTNARGVIMFVMLLMALFGQASDAAVVMTASVVEVNERIRQLQQERDELQKRIAALPPQGDPELAARYKAAMEQLRAQQAKLDAALAAKPRNQEEEEALKKRLEAALAARASATAAAKRVAPPEASQNFVRLSRFQADARRSVILAVSEGKLSRVRATSATDKISAPTTGTRITTVSQARGELQELLDGFPSATYRVELLVWEGSFSQAKMVEQALLEMGYDSNPIPLRSGQAIAPGVGGVQ